MIIKPKVRGFLCTTAHPAGCAENVRRQIKVARQGDWPDSVAKTALIIGCSTGYGLASRVCTTFGMRAKTLGVFFERPGSETRCGTAGWYNAAALRQEADKEGLYARDFNGDAFSDEMKERVIEVVKKELGTLDLVVYSLASPRRQHPRTGVVHKSVLKPIGQTVTSRTLDTDRAEVKDVTIEAASETDIADTVAVMGGEDWRMWIEALDKEKLLASGCKTVAYTYIGERITRPIYGDATIGEAKKDLDKSVIEINNVLTHLSGEARVGVLKAVVTQSSSAIPIMPLYLSLLFKVMKERGVHEGCIEQVAQLLMQLYHSRNRIVDEAERLRCDGIEMDAEIQRWVEEQWDTVTTENMMTRTDFAGYREEFLQLFGFSVAGVDYNQDISAAMDVGGLYE